MSAPAVERPVAVDPIAEQQHTIYVLADIASRRLPTLSWHLSGTTVDRLEGQVGPDSDEVKRATVAAYAALLGEEPTERQRDCHVRCAVAGLFRGVWVTVYAHVEQVVAVSRG